MAAAIDPRLGQYKSTHPQHHLTHHHSNHSSQHHLPQLPQLPHPHSRLHQLPPLQPPLQPAHHSYQIHQPLARHIHDSSTHPYYAQQPPSLHQPHHFKEPLQSQDHQVDSTLDNDHDSLDDATSPQDADFPDDPASMGSAGGAKGSDAKRPRACDSCRGLKVKCIIDPSSGEPCKRCAKAGRQCLVTPPTRKRQKKADSRVAELERKIDALTATLAQRDGKVPPTYAYSAKREFDSYESSPVLTQSGDSVVSPHPSKRPRLAKLMEIKHEPILAGSAADPATQQTPTAASSSLYNQSRPMVYDHSDIDENLNKLISEEDAERLFNRYVNEIVPQFPAVPFPPGTTAREVRKSKPILFLAILAGTSYGAGISADTQIALEKEFRDVMATCIWKTGEKSLQLVQALQVGALWYRPPANFEQHMFYQMVHASTIMAIDIGIGKRQSAWRKHFQKDIKKGSGKPTSALPNLENAEARRAWLINYFLCITIAIILRRPILLRFNAFMKECLEALESSEGALPSDKILCQHIEHARILEDIAIQFALDDPAVNLTMKDGKVSYGIKHHEHALADLRARSIESPAIQLSAHVTNLYLHEIALHNHSNVEDFKTSFTEETFRGSTSVSVINESHVDALIECQNSCLKVIESFLSIEVKQLLLLPVIFSVRMIYAVVVLIKLYISATTPGEIATIINKKDLRIDESIANLEAAFQRIVDHDQLSPHTKFLYVIQRLGDRWVTIKRRQTGKGKPGMVVEANKEKRISPKPRPRSETSVANLTETPQAQGLHLLSEVAANSTVSSPQLVSTMQVSHAGTTSTAAVTPIPSNTAITRPRRLTTSATSTPMAQQQPHHQHIQQQPPQAQWYQPSPSDEMAAASAMQGIDGQMYDFQGQLSGMEAFDFGLGGFGMGMDGAITSLFMENPGPWSNSPPGAFFGGGWHI